MTESLRINQLIDVQYSDDSEKGYTWVSARVLSIDRNMLSVAYESYGMNGVVDTRQVQLAPSGTFTTTTTTTTNKPSLKRASTNEPPINIRRSSSSSSSARKQSFNSTRRRASSHDISLPSEKVGSHRPIFTNIIIFTVIIVFLIEMYFSEWEFVPLETNPMYGPSVELLQEMGALDVTLIREEGQWYRLISGSFLHAGVIHLIANVLSLNIMRQQEQYFSTWNVIVIYFASTILSSIWSSIFLPRHITVGSSGALFGAIGAEWASLIQNWALLDGKCAYFSTLLFCTILNLAFGMLPFVNNYAHVGGLICGFLLGLTFYIMPRVDSVYGMPQRPNKLQGCQSFLGNMLLVVVFMISLITLYFGTDPLERCPQCHYINCIPNDYFPCDVDLDLL